MEYTMPSGNLLSVFGLSEQTFRIQIRKPYDKESALDRYEILNTLPAYACDTTQTQDVWVCKTPAATLRVSMQDGQFTLCDAKGDVLLDSTCAPRNTREGFSASMHLPQDARLYGLGDVTRDRIEKRGYATDIWVENVKSYVPIPFLLSDKGWGMFLNTTWRNHIDVGAEQADTLTLSGDGGALDLYLFVGEDYESLLNEYTNLLGKPTMMPAWAYGLVYVCNQDVTARAMMEDCLNFRREGIPCDVCGLEPGWMSQNYDFSIEKKWHPDRFYLPYWAPKGEQTFFGALDRLGFKLSLWLCCDYDLSFLEEQTLHTHPTQGEDGGFEQDAHFQKGKLSMDRYTKVDEAWFEHLKKFVDQGARCFKLDGANQIVEHPDRKWGNGMDDAEMHNLYPLLYNKQMTRGYEDYTGLRSMVYSAGGYAGIQRYSATWAGDTGGGPQPLVSMLNHGFSGHSNTSCDMDVFSNAGIHFGFFQPWSQLCNWAYWRQPWFLPPERKALYQFYARLRYRMLPYIYTAAHRANRTGYPIMRAMALSYPTMENVDALIYQYMFGDALLTAAFADHITLPAGRWIDAWQDTSVEGGVTIPVDFPATVGGPLLIREGAIIPCCEPGEFIGQRPLETLSLHVYPSSTPTSYELYEDDGATRAYTQGAFATTQITCVRKDDHILVTIGAREGHFDGQTAIRNYVVDVHQCPTVASVTVHGVALPFETAHDGWCGHSEAGFLRFRIEDCGEADILLSTDTKS